MPEIALINPRRRRRRRRVRARSVYVRSPYRRRRRRRRTARRSRLPVTFLKRHHLYATNPRRRRYRRNPIRGGFSVQGFVNETLVPSAIGAAGALGLDVLMNVVPLPETFKTGMMRPVTKLAGAIGLGMIAGMIASRRVAEQVTAGAVTVVLYDVMKGLMMRTMPQLALSEYSDAMNALTVDESVGAVTDEYPAMGYTAPAVQVGDESVSAYV